MRHRDDLENPQSITYDSGRWNHESRYVGRLPRNESWSREFARGTVNSQMESEREREREREREMERWRDGEMEREGSLPQSGDSQLRRFLCSYRISKARGSPNKVQQAFSKQPRPKRRHVTELAALGLARLSMLCRWTWAYHVGPDRTCHEGFNICQSDCR